MAEPVFEAAGALDANELARIDSASRRGWPPHIFLAELERRPPSVFVLREEGRVTAFTVVRIVADELDIVNFAVAADRRRLGLGRLLLRRLVERARAGGIKRAFLEVRRGNEAARALYRDFGFTETQIRPNFYVDPVEDAVLMSRPIGDRSEA